MQLRRARGSCLAVACAAAVVLLAACTTAPAPTAPPSTTTPTAPQEADGQYAEPGAAATWDQASADAAAQAATTAMTAFTSHSPDAAAWWAQLQPLLSPTAARDYAGVDPTNVPARRLTGPTVIERDPSAYLATALVSTDRGAYTVLLSRQGGDKPWLVERLTPPPSASDSARS